LKLRSCVFLEVGWTRTDILEKRPGKQDEQRRDDDDDADDEECDEDEDATGKKTRKTKNRPRPSRW